MRSPIARTPHLPLTLPTPTRPCVAAITRCAALAGLLAAPLSACEPCDYLDEIVALDPNSPVGVHCRGPDGAALASDINLAIWLTVDNANAVRGFAPPNVEAEEPRPTVKPPISSIDIRPGGTATLRIKTTRGESNADVEALIVTFRGLSLRYELPVDQSGKADLTFRLSDKFREAPAPVFQTLRSADQPAPSPVQPTDIAPPAPDPRGALAGNVYLSARNSNNEYAKAEPLEIYVVATDEPLASEGSIITSATAANPPEGAGAGNDPANTLDDDDDDDDTRLAAHLTKSD